MFEQNEKLLQLSHALRDGENILIEELWDSPKALVAELAQRTTGKHVLIITAEQTETHKLFHNLVHFSDHSVHEFPAWEALPEEKIAPSPDIVGERYQVLESVLNETKPALILSSLQACLQQLIVPNQFSDLYLSIAVNEEVDFDKVITQLVSMGYRREGIVADKGEFAVRGGIIDVFPVSSPDPFRIEFWGDEVQSIRTFDPVAQTSVARVKELKITAAREMELLQKSQEKGSILDYLCNDAIIVFDDLLRLEDRWIELKKLLQNQLNFYSFEEFLKSCENLQKIFFSQQPIEELSQVRALDRKAGGYYSESGPMHALSFEIFEQTFDVKRWQNPFIPLSNYLLPTREEGDVGSGIELLRAVSSKEISLQFLCQTEAEERTLHKMIVEEGVTLPKTTETVLGYLSSGFVLSNQVVFPYTELTGRFKIRRQKLRSTYHMPASEMFDIIPGEMVVHFHNGIGKYLGTEKRRNHEGFVVEFFVIEYSKGAKLFVPLDQAHLITKYIGSGEEAPKPHELGSKKWAKTREKTEIAILGYAKDLLRLQAEREIKGGFAYPEDGSDFTQFEEEFPFAETEDQLAAIKGIKEDMISQKPMDRLVCGDVGYGKTEVAMRAAFKAVCDGGKQVAVLVPTTVLAMQHYDNFKERMENFPVNVACLSRFQSTKERKKTIEGLLQGSVDIVVGTHRLISKDVEFKNLGLVIIDEEQRFGVKAKEHLKQIKTGVDYLTLSATPIPRTLYMSLIGARDMSVINTPPQDRLPIKTVITKPEDEIIKSALLRELSRDGQAYFVHNRVETIDFAASRIQKLLPQARIAIVHGQMHANMIDSVFHAFKNGTVDILVATSIVESGVDIPNANTILIDRAAHFGLADLYQLRGRVGRWNRPAFAYFLIQNPHSLTEVSRKRLNALAESSGYGGGMKLAMRDLEIRGAGDILGTEQSGNVTAIGFHLYCKLLKRTVKGLKGALPDALVEAKVEFPIEARLSEEYINESSLRVDIYHRLGDASTPEEVDEIFEEVQDRFGPIPPPAVWLYHLMRLRAWASLNGYALIKHEKLSLTVQKKVKGKLQQAKFIFKLPTTPQALENEVIRLLNF
ncbi:MAG: transcription-repair coupling factor [Waddliaceae bacterium]